MAKKSNNLLIIIILAVVVLLFLNYAGFFSLISSGNVNGARFIYLVTYSYTNGKAQNMAASVKLNNYTCQTTAGILNLGYPVAETDFVLPNQTGQPAPVYLRYNSGSSQSNITMCLITLPQTAVGNTISLIVSAQNRTSGYASRNYSIQAQIGAQQGPTAPLLFTIPLLPNSALITTSSTSSTSTTTSSTLMPGQTSMTSTSTTTSTTIPQQQGQNLLQAILAWVNNLISGILKLL